jgi:DNA-3-methyladenine glycosylase
MRLPNQPSHITLGAPLENVRAAAGAILARALPVQTTAPRLPQEFFERSVHEVARDLIGCTVAHGDIAGAIVETESYHAEDPACHAFGGPTPRSSVLFGPPGHAYVYLSYGIHSLLNFVAEREGEAAAVLIRALEPTAGLARMRARRELERTEDLCSGPGKLTEALAIGLDLNGVSLADGPIEVRAREPGWEEPRSSRVLGSASARRRSTRGAFRSPAAASYPSRGQSRDRLPARLNRCPQRLTLKKEVA